MRKKRRSSIKEKKGQGGEEIGVRKLKMERGREDRKKGMKWGREEMRKGKWDVCWEKREQGEKKG